MAWQGRWPWILAASVMAASGIAGAAEVSGDVFATEGEMIGTPQGAQTVVRVATPRVTPDGRAVFAGNFTDSDDVFVFIGDAVSWVDTENFRGTPSRIAIDGDDRWVMRGVGGPQFDGRVVLWSAQGQFASAGDPAPLGGGEIFSDFDFPIATIDGDLYFRGDYGDEIVTDGQALFRTQMGAPEEIEVYFGPGDSIEEYPFEDISDMFLEVSTNGEHTALLAMGGSGDFVALDDTVMVRRLDELAGSQWDQFGDFSVNGCGTLAVSGSLADQRPAIVVDGQPVVIGGDSFVPADGSIGTVLLSPSGRLVFHSEGGIHVVCDPASPSAATTVIGPGDGLDIDGDGIGDRTVDSAYSGGATDEVVYARVTVHDERGTQAVLIASIPIDCEQPSGLECEPEGGTDTGDGTGDETGDGGQDETGVDDTSGAQEAGGPTTTSDEGSGGTMASSDTGEADGCSCSAGRRTPTMSVLWLGLLGLLRRRRQ